MARDLVRAFTKALNSVLKQISWIHCPPESSLSMQYIRDQAVKNITTSKLLLSPKSKGGVRDWSKKSPRGWRRLVWCEESTFFATADHGFIAPFQIASCASHKALLVQIKNTGATSLKSITHSVQPHFVRPFHPGRHHQHVIRIQTNPCREPGARPWHRRTADRILAFVQTSLNQPTCHSIQWLKRH